MRRDRARSIAIDLILFASTFGIGAWLEVATPHQRFIQGDLLWRYSYPHGENTVPAVVVPHRVRRAVDLHAVDAEEVESGGAQRTGDRRTVRERRFDLGRDVRYEKHHRRHSTRLCRAMLARWEPGVGLGRCAFVLGRE